MIMRTSDPLRNGVNAVKRPLIALNIEKDEEGGGEDSLPERLLTRSNQFISIRCILIEMCDDVINISEYYSVVD